MCSINGFNFQDEGLIKRMNEITKHRGPDDSGVFLSSRWSLGHNRLSIIDLSSTGHQPMLSADKKFAIIFNGEIYNFLEIKKELEALGYKFKSKTDTEVILYAYQEWGSACLQKFNGMFALAILNTETEELFFAKNAKTAIDVAAARGVILLAGERAHLPIFQYTPLQVKSALTGYGKAEKGQVEFMVGKILHLKDKIKPDDAADAVAIALTHAFRVR